MSNEHLPKLLEIPRGGSPPFEGNWRSVEQPLGLALPGSYKTLVDRFGASTWADFLHVLSPFDEEYNLQDVGRQVIEADKVSRSKFPSHYPLPLFPEAGGLLPWAVTDNGDVLYFITRGPADDWPTLIKGPRAPEFEVSFLAPAMLAYRIAAGFYRSTILPEL
ncbi:hypothetical protein Pan216_21880 [Planctomycetes bacterium Pan216]|uniref:SMI1 / KNR4 family protein n=1 Tax=Kolteria novifilia TaxID=2527975 RepID=A0A518B2W8_9BACT|nr:hypothetical protein Pan216_21880 [Planctomycetes bacterium Pan216]